MHAAVLWGGPNSALGAATAAVLHGLRYVAEQHTARVHLLMPYGTGRKSTRFVTVRLAQRVPAVWMRDGLPVVAPARAVVDACRGMGSVREVRALVTEAVQQGRTKWTGSRTS